MARYNGKELKMLESKDPANLDLSIVMPLLRETAEEAERDGLTFRARDVRQLIKEWHPETAPAHTLVNMQSHSRFFICRIDQNKLLLLKHPPPYPPLSERTCEQGGEVKCAGFSQDRNGLLIKNEHVCKSKFRDGFGGKSSAGHGRNQPHSGAWI